MNLKLESVKQKPDTRVSFSINLLDQKEEQGQTWLYYQIKLQNGREELIFKSTNKKTVSAVGTVAEIGKFAFAIKPHNELQAFKDSLKSFLNSKQKSFRFEPSDPSFELVIERLPVIGEETNFKVYFWVDAGNTKDLEYTWDGIGVRFISSIDNLDQLSQNLEALV